MFNNVKRNMVLAGVIALLIPNQSNTWPLPLPGTDFFSSGISFLPKVIFSHPALAAALMGLSAWGLRARSVLNKRFDASWPKKKSLSGNKFTSVKNVLASVSPDTVEIDFSGQNITRVELGDLWRMNDVKQVDLSNNNMRYFNVEEVSKNFLALEFLDISGNENMQAVLTGNNEWQGADEPQGLFSTDSFNKLDKLKKIYLKNTGITKDSEQAKILQNHLPNGAALDFESTCKEKNRGLFYKLYLE